METWELTEYEQERKPQAITMEQPITLSSLALRREFMCPICLSVLTHTRAAPDCLHRFCKKCVDKAVKKECPVCKKKLPSQAKSFREDPKFDQLISKICGFSGKPTSDSNANNIIRNEYEIVLTNVYDHEKKRYIKCPGNTTVDHLTKYLAMRPEDVDQMPNLNNGDEFKLCIIVDRSTGEYQPLSGNLKLAEVKSTYNLNTDIPLELYFYQQKTNNNDAHITHG